MRPSNALARRKKPQSHRSTRRSPDVLTQNHCHGHPNNQIDDLLRTRRRAQSRGLKTPLSKQLVGVEIVAPAPFFGKARRQLEALVAQNPALLFQRPGPPLALERRAVGHRRPITRECPLRLENVIFYLRDPRQRQVAAAWKQTQSMGERLHRSLASRRTSGWRNLLLVAEAKLATSL